MSERKVLNKYFPPDFDPSKIPRRKINKDAQQTVRLMAPYTMCCKTCGEFIYKGKKFNAKKETALGEEYYGIKIFRFYIKCTRCSAEITFKTDPKNADYIAEHGHTRNYEQTTAEATRMPTAADDDSDAGNDSDPEDPMKALEENQAAAKRQMEDEDDLADLRQRNARLEKGGGGVDVEELMRRREEGKSKEEEERRKREREEEDEEVNKYFYKVQAPAGMATIVEERGKGKGKGKGKGRAEEGGAGLMGGYGSGSGSDSGGDDDDEDDQGENKAETPSAPSTVTVKKTAASLTSTQPTVADLLAAKGISLPSVSKPATATASASASAVPKNNIKNAVLAGVKAGGLAGIKRKDSGNAFGVKAKKAKV